MAALWSRSMTNPESRTRMDPFLQRFRNQLTTAAALLARVVGVHQHHLPSGTCSLGGAEGLEMSPTSIQHGRVEASFRAGPIGQEGAYLLWVRLGFGRLAHRGDVQVFQDHHAKAIHQGTCGFV
jgi:hypothetical protein